MFQEKISKLTALFLLIAMVAGCSGGGAPEGNDGQTPGSHTELVVADTQEWQGTDVYQINFFTQGQNYIADPLFYEDQETGELIPGIAAGIEVSEDGNTITILMPEDFEFASGVPLTAEDVKRSIEWGLEKSEYSEDYEAIESIDVDGNKVVLHMREFSQAVMFYLQDPYIGVISKEQLDSLSAEELLMQAQPYGLFYMDEYVSGSHATLLRHEDYKTNNSYLKNKGPAHIEKVTVRFISEAFTAIEGIKAGEIDVVFSVPAEYIPELDERDDISLFKYATPGCYFMVLNKEDPLFTDENVRKAIALAIDREQIAELTGGLINPAYSFIVPGMMDYDSGIADYYKNTHSNDVEQAKQLLASAGWTETNSEGYLVKDGRTFEFSYSVTSGSTSEYAAQVVQMQLKAVGIKINIEAMDRGNRRTQLREGNYQASVHEFTWAEPASILPYFLDDKNNLDDSTYYDLVFGAGAETDQSVRIEMFADAQQILMDELGQIPLFQVINARAYRNDLEGIFIDKDGTVFINDIE